MDIQGTGRGIETKYPRDCKYTNYKYKALIFNIMILVKLIQVAGWGLTSENGNPSEELKGITLPSIPRYLCRENFPVDFRPYLTPGKFCAGYQNGSSVCQGDSGGGLCFPRALDQNTTVYFLRGIVSVGPTREGSCDSEQYTVFTSVLANLEWLKTQRAHLSV